ncbi:MAG: hypothetical protein OXC30_00995, partial [Alphaproteobacteria bacterium]|nr:hypothetical protein [Alphaproteobacteria bacterium]
VEEPVVVSAYQREQDAERQGFVVDNAGDLAFTEPVDIINDEPTTAFSDDFGLANFGGEAPSDTSFDGPGASDNAFDVPDAVDSLVPVDASGDAVGDQPYVESLPSEGLSAPTDLTTEDVVNQELPTESAALAPAESELAAETTDAPTDEPLTEDAVSESDVTDTTDDVTTSEVVEEDGEPKEADEETKEERERRKKAAASA